MAHNTRSIDFLRSELRSSSNRGAILFRGGYVVTMDEAGDIPDCDVLIDNGEIIAVGQNLSRDGAQEIDASGCIVLPGLVDTHWHMWTSLLRNMSGSCGRSYGAVVGALQPGFGHTEMYLSVALAAAEALSAGITTVHDWCHNIPSVDFAEQDLHALADVGIRARFSYGPSFGLSETETMDLPGVRNLAQSWSEYSAGGLIHLGIAWRGLLAIYFDQGQVRSRPAPEAVYRAEYDLARSLNLPLSVHANVAGADAGHVAAMADKGLLYHDLQIIHGLSCNDEEIRALAAAGSSISVAPVAAMRTGLGFPRILAYAEAGVKVGLSIDSTPFAGSADMFALMKLGRMVENVAAGQENGLPARRVLEMATIEGARTLGLDHQIGSLVAGKRADVVMVDARYLNLAPFTYADHMLVDAANPGNVDTVVVDGRVVKRGGELITIDRQRLAARANESNLDIRKRASWQ